MPTTVPPEFLHGFGGMSMPREGLCVNEDEKGKRGRRTRMKAGCVPLSLAVSACGGWV